MKILIYENDIPSKEDALLYDFFGSYRGPLNTKPRFKPNGITNNIKEWRRKNNIIEGMGLLAKAGISSKDIKF